MCALIMASDMRQQIDIALLLTINELLKAYYDFQLNIPDWMFLLVKLLLIQAALYYTWDIPGWAFCLLTFQLSHIALIWC